MPLFIIAGQSNAVGAAASVADLPPGSPYLVAQPNVLFFGPYHETPTAQASWNPLLAPTELTQGTAGAAGTQSFGPEISLGRTISATLLGGGKVALVKLAVGGTTLATDTSTPADGKNYRPDWNPASKGELYDQLLARVNAALATPLPGGDTPKLAGFFWMQGENDASDGAFNPRYQPAGAAHNYGANLTTFIASVRKDLDSPDLPFVVGQIRDLGYQSRTVRQAQVDITRDVANTGLTVTDDLPLDPRDNMHFSTQGTIDLGIRFAQTYSALTPVPEPGTWCMAAAALALAFGRRIRR